MKTITLSKRLQAIASLIKTGASVADIGTDHGYLPIYLVQTGTAVRVIASDASPGSLETAKKNAVKYNVTQHIEFVLAQGLDHINQSNTDTIDTIVIAGIGGENMINILENAPRIAERVRSGRLTLILQAQTKLDVLRFFLHNSGYIIRDEIKITDRNRDYTIFSIHG